MNKLEIDGLALVDVTLRRNIAAVLRKIHRHANLGEALISVTLVDDDQMKALNSEYRGKELSTDVLSFAAQDGEFMPGTEHILGDVIISVDRAKAQALEFGHGLHEELAVLLAHGILHLLGLDHEKSEEESLKQASCEMAILDLAGIRPELALCSRNSCIQADLA